MLLGIRDNRRVAVKASHAVGKTFVAAVAACWWYDCWPEHIVYVTAPTWPQALGLTFKQIKQLRRERNLPGEILETGLVRDERKERQGDHFIRALNAESGEGFQGEHSAPILIIIEEGPGVPHYIWEASDGLMTHPDCRTFAVGNPTNEATDFGKACSLPIYTVQTISVLGHPNIAAEMQCESPPYPKAVRLLWLKEMLEKECERSDSPEGDAFEWWSLPVIEEALNGRPPGPGAVRWWYLPNAVFQGRALGQFPTQADEQVIPRGWLATCPVQGDIGEPSIGCDIARFGTDRTTIFSRKGPRALRGREIRKMDTVFVAEALREEARWLSERTGVPAKKIPIRVDVSGGLGAGPYDNLSAENYNVIGVNSGSSAQQKDQFLNVRSELWFALRERVRTKDLDLSLLPKDLRERVSRELTTPRYKVNPGGKKVVDGKDDIKKNLGESPDLADGLCLAFYGIRQRKWEFS